MQKKFVLFALALLAPTCLMSAQVDPVLSLWGVNCVGTIEVVNCPCGGGHRVANGCPTGFGYIWVTVIDTNGEPIPNIPRTDIWLDGCLPESEIFVCADQNVTDYPTDVFGKTMITEALFYGGCELSDGLSCYVMDPELGVPVKLMSPQCINIRFKSPDLTGSGSVNLSDLCIFGMHYNSISPSPYYDPCCDFIDDGKINISDFAFFGVHYQHACP
jgi:hypothetical protein